jgi:hypothetical protein
MRVRTPRIAQISTSAQSARLALSRLSPRTKLASIAGMALVLAVVPMLVTVWPAPSTPTTKGKVASASSSTGTTGAAVTTGTAGSRGGTSTQPTVSASGAHGGAGCQFASAPAGTSAAFCDPFRAPAGTGNRSGDLNGTVWGVSHLGDENVGLANAWTTGSLNLCGTTVDETAGTDVRICDGHLADAVDDGGHVTALAMYPKQPFDIAGRTGTAVFDVTDDSQGTHAAWPEFWYTDQPVPAPFQHESTLLNLPHNGIGVRFAGACPQGQGYNCGPNCPGNNTQQVVSVDSADVVTNYQPNDSFSGGSLSVQGDNCVVAGSASSDTFNHIEIRLNPTSGVDVYGTDAFTPGSALPPLKHLAHIGGPLPLTRGLIWVEDAHYNADKFNSQGTHTFYWANVGFDGPVLAQDRSYDVLDNPACCNSDGTRSLGYSVGVGGNESLSVHTLSVDASALARASGAALLYGFWSEQSGFTLTVSVNGHAPHRITWPFPDSRSFTPLTYFYPLPLSELVAGPNTITFSTDGSFNANLFNINLVAIGGGGIP